MISTGHMHAHTLKSPAASQKNPPWISSCSDWLLQYLQFLLHHRLPVSLRERRLLRSPGQGTLLYCRLPRCSEPGVIWLHHLFNNSKHRRGSEWFTPQRRWAQNADGFLHFSIFSHVRYQSSFFWKCGLLLHPSVFNGFISKNDPHAGWDSNTHKVKLMHNWLFYFIWPFLNFRDTYFIAVSQLWSYPQSVMHIMWIKFMTVLRFLRL